MPVCIVYVCMYMCMYVSKVIDGWCGVVVLAAREVSLVSVYAYVHVCMCMCVCIYIYIYIYLYIQCFYVRV